MATPTLPVLTTASVAQMINEDDFLTCRLIVGDRFGVIKEVARRLREQGLYRVSLPLIYVAVHNHAGIKTIYDGKV